jgi:dienelactone hydrolase
MLELPVASPASVSSPRHTVHEGVQVSVLVMNVSEDLSVPAYLLRPATDCLPGTAVMAIHGHSSGKGEGSLGLRDDAYCGFAVELARAGHVVLLPIHRGFGPMRDLAAGRPGYRMDYEQSMHFSYVTDAFLHGCSVVGQNIEDLLRWENWLAAELSVTDIFAAGLSYGGDLAVAYPVFSQRVRRIFASGSSGSFALHFCRCYNGPAHCIPGIVNWMERSDIAGMNAPRPLVVHYGQRDTPSLNEPGKENYAAAYNEAVPEMMEEIRQIYAAAGSADNVRLIVSPDMGHAMDVPALLEFFGDLPAPGGKH